MIERYLSPKMKGLFSDESRFNAYLKVEEASIEGWVSIGVIPVKDAKLIEEKAHVDVAKIKELEAITKHDVVAFTRQISLTLGEEKKWVHYGLTSTDVVDTALGLLYKKADDVIYGDLLLLKKALADKAHAYKMTPCIGRTHGMHAEPTSFGLKWALYFDELNRGIEDFEEKRQLIEVCKLSGALGNFANVDPRVETKASALLGLHEVSIASQVISRDRQASYGSSLTIISTLLEKIALEIRNLSRSEVGEVEEGFKKGQKGSSAMPQKRNPIASENIDGCARLMRGYLLPLLEDNALFHERDISHSSVERVAFIDMIELFAYMLERMTSIIDNLTVYPERMFNNIYLSHGACFSQRALTALIEKGWSREEAYDLVQPLAMKSLLEGVSFKEQLESNPKVSEALSNEEIEKLFSLDYYLKNVDYLYKRVGL